MNYSEQSRFYSVLAMYGVHSRKNYSQQNHAGSRWIFCRINFLDHFVEERIFFCQIFFGSFAYAHFCFGSFQSSGSYLGSIPPYRAWSRIHCCDERHALDTALSITEVCVQSASLSLPAAPYWRLRLFIVGTVTRSSSQYLRRRRQTTHLIGRHCYHHRRPRPRPRCRIIGWIF